MIKLPQVTLLIYNPDKSPELGEAALKQASTGIEYGHVVQICSRAPENAEFPYVLVPESSWKEGQRFQSYLINDFFNTEFVLHIETDGYPVNPELWQDKFLQFDYVGAPWPTAYTQNNRVGNGGCSLRSKKFTQWCSDHRNEYVNGMSSDIWFCQYMYPENRHVIKYADLETAIQFSFEFPVSEFPEWTWEKSFAFHGKFEHLRTPYEKVNKLIPIQK
jgi:hypothetical protein